MRTFRVPGFWKIPRNYIRKALFGQGNTRVFWTAFAILGWGYLLWALAPWSHGWVAPSPLSTFVAAFLEPKVHQQALTGWGWISLPYEGFGLKTIEQGPRYFREMVHTFTTLLIALSGGTLARRFFGPAAEGRMSEGKAGKSQGARKSHEDRVQTSGIEGSTHDDRRKSVAPSVEHRTLAEQHVE